jgi:hypothetical protein
VRVTPAWIAVAAALAVDSRAASPQAATGADERVDRMVGMALTQGGAHAFLHTLTDTIGGRVTGSAESRATAELLVRTLREAGFEDAHFEEYPFESRWQRGRAAGRIVAPVDPRMLALDTAVLAVTAYRPAQAPEAPGRLSAAEATQLLMKLGLESLRRTVYEPGEAK